MAHPFFWLFFVSSERKDSTLSSTSAVELGHGVPLDSKTDSGNRHAIIQYLDILETSGNAGSNGYSGAANSSDTELCNRCRATIRLRVCCLCKQQWIDAALRVAEKSLITYAPVTVCVAPMPVIANDQPLKEEGYAICTVAWISRVLLLSCCFQHSYIQDAGLQVLS
ncbi:hypothetical protein LX32DRAFT_70437 [Colletotrichum zoysiae]|uniref:Uncharacterized protein n=1 Tax=Colletotrichum zoysiae TaxID=1216348 RepID=A0AAD9LWP9_9PEZI|nr:hypothetical protein LX32DRAFT_70437 [Colletotrichum zoysiae]